MSPPTPPDDLHESGQRIWAELTKEYVFDPHEAKVLHELCRTADVLDALAAVAEAEGVTIDGKVHPAVVEARQQRITFARLVASLRLPDEDEVRPQRRGAMRKPYSNVRTLRDASA